jgi:hypothetical protein
MTAYRSQLERVRMRLHDVGRITRNECVRQVPAILRLSARIQDLEEEGYVFEAKEEHNDYVYRLLKRPAAKTLLLKL